MHTTVDPEESFLQRLKRCFFNPQEVLTSSDEVVFELDFTDQKTMNSLERCQRLSKNRTLEDVMPPEMFERLKNQVDYAREMIPLWMSDEQKNNGERRRTG